jgi:hypothetical protein
MQLFSPMGPRATCTECSQNLIEVPKDIVVR